MEFSFGISLFVGLIAAPLISFLKKQTWSSEVKQGISLAICSFVAAVSLLVSGDLRVDNLEGLGAQVGVVFATSQVFYRQYFGETTFNQKIETKGVK